MNRDTPGVRRVDYNDIASTYDERYDASPLHEVSDALVKLLERTNATWVLEVGCGTGHWLATLATEQRQLFGLDPSTGMLRRAQARADRFRVLQGWAEELPLATRALDLLYVVNALHHFRDHHRFLAQARRVLKPGGALAIVGFDPREHRDWLIYRYFEGTYAIDLERMPASAAVRASLQEAGFIGVQQQMIRRTYKAHYGRDVLDDPFLQKHGTSELVLLSDEAYEAGLQRIREAIEEAEQAGEQAVFQAHIEFTMITGSVPQ